MKLSNPNIRGIVYAYHDHPDLGELCKKRTAAALPFCGRYRLIDLAMSSMMNAGITDVDILMQYGYQSLLDHLRGGRPWTRFTTISRTTYIRNTAS